MMVVAIAKKALKQKRLALSKKLMVVMTGIKEQEVQRQPNVVYLDQVQVVEGQLVVEADQDKDQLIQDVLSCTGIVTRMNRC